MDWTPLDDFDDYSDVPLDGSHTSTLQKNDIESTSETVDDILNIIDQKVAMQQDSYGAHQINLDQDKDEDQVSSILSTYALQIESPDDFGQSMTRIGNTTSADLIKEEKMMVLLNKKYFEFSKKETSANLTKENVPGETTDITSMFPTVFSSDSLSNNESKGDQNTKSKSKKINQTRKSDVKVQLNPPGVKKSTRTRHGIDIEDKKDYVLRFKLD